MGRDSFCAVPQGSILGPLLFNIFTCDLFSIMNKVDFARYADDNTPHQTNYFTGLQTIK